MQASLDGGTRPEAMADVPGICELPLTRAVVQYGERHEVDPPGGRIEDIGLGLVLEGRYASHVEAVDLGSGRLRLLDLSTELVILDWAYEPTHEHLGRLLRASATRPDATDPAPARELRAYCFEVAVAVLERIGFGPLTRPTLLRIGFRDLCRDLDLHEATSVRIVLGAGRVTRVHLDYDGVALVFRTATGTRDRLLEDALADAFPAGRVVPLVASGHAPGGYQVRLPLPLDADELRRLLATVRGGLVHLLARFEPARYRALDREIRTFGERRTLDRLRLRAGGGGSGAARSGARRGAAPADSVNTVGAEGGRASRSGGVPERAGGGSSQAAPPPGAVH